MIVKVTQYLEELRIEEEKKPPAQRRLIPRQVDLAEAAGVTPQAFSYWIRQGEDAPLNKDYLDAIITKMRANGFPTILNDLVEYVPPPGLEINSDK